MTFALSREHETFRRSVREFAEAEIAPHVAQWDRDDHFPVATVQKMGEFGLFGLTAPEEFGGAEGDFTSLCVAIEELGRVRLRAPPERAVRRMDAGVREWASVLIESLA